MTFMKMRDVRIVVCPRCQGTGTLEMATGDEDRCKTIFCPLCNGMRVLKRTVTIEYNVVNNAHESEKEYPSLEPERIGYGEKDGPGKVKYSGRNIRFVLYVWRKDYLFLRK